MDSQRKKEEIKTLGSTGPGLWFGIETWKIRRTDERKLFQYQCRIRWQQRIPLRKRVGEIAEIVELLKLRASLTKELEVVGTGPQEIW